MTDSKTAPVHPLEIGLPGKEDKMACKGKGGKKKGKGK